MSLAFDTASTQRSARDFQHLLLNVYGFRKSREEGQRSVWRGPSGGTLRVNNSLSGLADPQQVAKAADILNMSVGQFWGQIDAPRGQVKVNTHRSEVTPIASVNRNGDSYIAIVLSVHTAQDRPMSFDQVMKIATKMGYQITRAQVVNASASLCKDGDLVRTRHGVYQWSGGKRINKGRGDHTVDINVTQGNVRPSTLEVIDPIKIVSPESSEVAVDDVFELLFPNGVKMERLDDSTDLNEWKRLTAKFLGLTV